MSPLPGKGPLPRTALVVAVIAVLTMFLQPGAAAAAAEGLQADPQYGIGGSSSFPAGTVFSVAPGDRQPPVQSILVQNVGNRVADIRLVITVADGIRIVPAAEQFRLRPKAHRSVPFAIEVDPAMAGGSYPALIQARQTNVPAPKTGGVRYRPAFDLRFTVAVVGESADVTVRAVDDVTGRPVAGTISIGMAVREGSPITVRQVNGSELQTTLAPGDYVASYEIPRLTRVEQPFTIADDEERLIELRIKSVSFSLVAARERSDGRNLQSVDLLANVANHVKPVRGPVKVQVNVLRDETPVETVLLQDLPVLQTRTTEFRQNWAPEGGWQPGTYTFHFQVVAPEFTVDAAEVPTVVVSGFPWWLVIAAVVVSLALIALFWWWRRRRKRQQEAVGTPPPGAGRVPAAMPPPSGPRYG